MKLLHYVLLLLVFVAYGGTQKTNRSWEDEIRSAEQKHLSAFASNDAAAIEALFSDDFLVNSPRYVVLDKGQLMELVRRGMLTTHSFSLEIERIRRWRDVAVVMGRDSIVFASPAPNAGYGIRRRFTDIWQLTDGQWHFIARHANPICE